MADQAFDSKSQPRTVSENTPIARPGGMERVEENPLRQSTVTYRIDTRLVSKNLHGENTAAPDAVQNGTLAEAKSEGPAAAPAPKAQPTPVPTASADPSRDGKFSWWQAASNYVSGMVTPIKEAFATPASALTTVGAGSLVAAGMLFPGTSWFVTPVVVTAGLAMAAYSLWNFGRKVNEGANNNNPDLLEDSFKDLGRATVETALVAAPVLKGGQVVSAARSASMFSRVGSVAANAARFGARPSIPAIEVGRIVGQVEAASEEVAPVPEQRNSAVPSAATTDPASGVNRTGARTELDELLSDGVEPAARIGRQKGKIDSETEEGGTLLGIRTKGTNYTQN